ncbi:hypothetical protein MLD38_007198 [Melastoma candidum]|uniref:Uncharacterized protein n=1 Tax=Melastoma candidum TaxID=119954 RepID=A0ACB9RQ09_9MYRT|nr:hypothetical protein MLD38_007198 [Melastoma candidum]
MLLGIHIASFGRLLDNLVIAFNVLLTQATLSGFLRTRLHVKWLVGIYVPLMVLMIVFLFCFTILVSQVTSKGVDKVSVPANSHWLRKWVNNANTWNCLFDIEFCSEFFNTYWDDTPRSFNSTRLSLLQSGCCKPSYDCKLFTDVSPTDWKRTNSSVYTNPGCHTWANKPTALCYDCESREARNNWRNSRHGQKWLLLLFTSPCS